MNRSVREVKAQELKQTLKANIEQPVLQRWFAVTIQFFAVGLEGTGVVNGPAGLMDQERTGSMTH